jgi:glycosyltransferase involved in cell wall biosynthesis
MSVTQSIIVATFNSGKTLQATLDSLFVQTYKNFEVILVDGLSKDNTVEIIKQNEKRFIESNIPYIWSTEKDTGIYDAWNKGLSKVNSSWISFLGSDDTYYPNSLEDYNQAINKNHSINFISSKVEYIDSNDKILMIIGKPYEYKQMNRFMNIAHVGSFHHKELFEKHGGFNKNYKIVADYDFFLKCGLDIKSAFIDIITARMLNTGISNNNVKKVFKETLKIQLHHRKNSKLRCYFEYYFSFIRILKNRITYIVLGRM